jgi:hypothetical protein
MRFQFFVALTALMLFAVGCDKPSETAAGGGNSAASSDHDHDHDDHDHDHPEHGPNGGHLFETDSTEYVFEWQKFKDNNVIKMHVLDKDKNPVAVKVDSFKIMPMAGNDSSPFELVAETPDDEGKSSVYMLDDQDLSIAIPLGVNIEIVMGDSTIKGKIDQHEPLDH